MIREALNELRRILCRVFAGVSRRLWVPPPDIDDICHYALCPTCRQECEAQGWLVESKHNDNGEIYEVTFKDAQYEGELKEKSREGLYV